MKKLLLFPAAAIILLLSISCKKENEKAHVVKELAHTDSLKTAGTYSTEPSGSSGSNGCPGSHSGEDAR